MASPEASAVAAPLFGTPIPPPSIVAPPTRFAASSSPVGDAVISFVPGVGPGSAARVTAPPASAGSALADVPAASSTSPAAASSASATRVGSVLPPAPARSVAPPAPARSVPSVSPAIPAAAPPAPATPAAASVTPAAASATPVASSAASVTPVASSAASATPVASSAPSARPADTDGETLLRAPRPLAVLALRWDDGTRVGVYGRTLFGRNPAPDEGATTIAVRDETLSLSKTHFEIGGDAASGAWVVDRHSTNGTVLVRGGVRSPLAPGARTPLQAGDRLEMGDRSVEVGDPS
ncbi:FHA domain-containing protein [Microbacterium ulmi]|uniref:FHA domain-containing protein n=1 Tax=Microbacterium ulmi TaxID=179095 RepID=UPI00201E0E5B|nr:FHA domain-containing protein [Microbacterium ulmi]